MAEQDQDTTMVEVEYFTADRMGERYGVSLKDALTVHPQARIIRYAGGAPFEGPEAKADVKEVKAEIRDERVAEKTAAAPEPANAAPSSKSDKE